MMIKAPLDASDFRPLTKPVHSPGLWYEQIYESGVMESKRQVSILHIEKEPCIEPLQPSEEISPDEHKRCRNCRDLGYFFIIGQRVQAAVFGRATKEQSGYH